MSLEFSDRMDALQYFNSVQEWPDARRDTAARVMIPGIPFKEWPWQAAVSFQKEYDWDRQHNLFTIETAIGTIRAWIPDALFMAFDPTEYCTRDIELGFSRIVAIVFWRAYLDLATWWGRDRSNDGWAATFPYGEERARTEQNQERFNDYMAVRSQMDGSYNNQFRREILRRMARENYEVPPNSLHHDLSWAARCPAACKAFGWAYAVTQSETVGNFTIQRRTFTALGISDLEQLQTTARQIAADVRAVSHMHDVEAIAPPPFTNAPPMPSSVLGAINWRSLYSVIHRSPIYLIPNI